MSRPRKSSFALDQGADLGELVGVGLGADRGLAEDQEGWRSAAASGEDRREGRAAALVRPLAKRPPSVIRAISGAAIARALAEV